MLPQRLINLKQSVRLNSTVALTKKEEYYKKQNTSALEVNEKPLGWDQAKPFESIPGPKPLPGIGNIFRFFPGGKYYGLNLLQFQKRLTEEYGSCVMLKGMPGSISEILMTFDPSDIETIFRVEGTWPIRHGMDSFRYYRGAIKKDLFQGVIGLLSLGGEEWAKIRSMVNPLLMQPKIVKQYIGNMNIIADGLLERVNLLAAQNKEMPEDFLMLLHKWALESVAVVAIDERLGCLDPNLPPDSPQNKYVDSVLEMLDLVYYLDILPSMWKYYSTKRWKRFVRLMDYITETNIAYLEKCKEKIEKNPHKSEEDMSVLEKLIKKDKTIALVMIMDMLIAGVDTTGKTMGAALYYLAKNPDKQEILRQEAIRILPSKNTAVTKEMLENAAYLKAVFKETTRIAPIATGTVRKIAKDAVIAGYQVPKGTQVSSAQLFVATSNKFVKRPLEFIPERFLRNEKDSELSYKNMHSFAYLPFGFGPRTCIGKRLANMELEVGLLKLVRNFKFDWPHEDIPFNSKLLYGIDGPLKLHITPLDNKINE
ncbi:unnamed protein product [Brassicogethes aeneus]|uniref:Cytochrome P450 n=1 Tax=Brassicogethes aeneus TaxID=1431903 RepID=A0A9P0AX07_BRAAE|nr:unnamed protein product [Brassicogethes aeneus]